ncbi:MAG: Crp/Fnr family transcriptional regulator, partial [Flavobacteriaceae bacterium]|nr:Crp/Fnr family transcriptional regulator [Flavobacteriaceae bacterium]
ASHTFCIQQQINDHKPVISLQFNEGELIFDEEQQLRGIYFIKSGVCKISKMSANGKEQIIHFLGEGTLLGIRSILNEETTNLKARALTPVSVCFLSKKSFFEILKDQNFIRQLLGTFAEYLKATDDRIVIMGQNKMVQRLAHFLIKIHDDFGEDTLGNLKLYLKREDMASYIGVTIESTIRMLKVFERKGLILIQGKTLKILDIGELKNISKGFRF